MAPEPQASPQVPPFICPRCNKEIAQQDIAVDKVEHRVRHGRTSSYYYTDEYYHRDCLALTQKEREEKAAQERKEKITKRKKKSIGWGIFAGVVALGISLALTIALASNGTIPMAAAIIGSIVFGYASFAAVYCIISGSFIEDVFLTVASWSIQFPGLIFSWDLEGFAWLIAMKLLFVALGALVTAAMVSFAFLLSAALAIFAFPFVLASNIRNGYSNQLD